DVVFAIEGTANLGPYFEGLRKHYLLLAIKYFNGGPAAEMDFGGDYAGTQYSLVVFNTVDCFPDSAYGFVIWLDGMKFMEGLIAEGVSRALQLFDDFKKMPEQTGQTHRLCLLTVTRPSTCCLLSRATHTLGARRRPSCRRLGTSVREGGSSRQAGATAATNRREPGPEAHGAGAGACAARRGTRSPECSSGGCPERRGGRQEPEGWAGPSRRPSTLFSKPLQEWSGPGLPVPPSRLPPSQPSLVSTVAPGPVLAPQLGSPGHCSGRALFSGPARDPGPRRAAVSLQHTPGLERDPRVAGEAQTCLCGANTKLSRSLPSQVYLSHGMVRFHFTDKDLDSLRGLYHILGNGFAGCVRFPTRPPARHVASGIREVITNHKRLQQQKLEQQLWPPQPQPRGTAQAPHKALLERPPAHPLPAPPIGPRTPGPTPNCGASSSTHHRPRLGFPHLRPLSTTSSHHGPLHCCPHRTSRPSSPGLRSFPPGLHC
ncbi:hypothetical protein EI555_002408, partial [Monodon monoceros]